MEVRERTRVLQSNGYALAPLEPETKKASPKKSGKEVIVRRCSTMQDQEKKDIGLIGIKDVHTKPLGLKRKSVEPESDGEGADDETGGSGAEKPKKVKMGTENGTKGVEGHFARPTSPSTVLD